MNYNTWMPAYGQPQPVWQMPRHEAMQGYPQNMQGAPAAPQSQQQGFLTRPVASREEAVAAQIDFFGPGVLMPDFGHSCVYYKRFNQSTGSCDFLTFRMEGAGAENTEKEETTEYATKADLLEIQQVIQGLAGDIDRLRTKGGKRLADE